VRLAQIEVEMVQTGDYMTSRHALAGFCLHEFHDLRMVPGLVEELPYAQFGGAPDKFGRRCDWSGT
jgi:hypothetical protein